MKSYTKDDYWAKTETTLKGAQISWQLQQQNNCDHPDSAMTATKSFIIVYTNSKCWTNVDNVLLEKNLIWTDNF